MGWALLWLAACRGRRCVVAWWADGVTRRPCEDLSNGFCSPI
jgi:hypothetical protein